MKKDENLNIEYKREFIDDIKNEIIAFLNTSGGKIYVGINDDKTTYKSFDVIERDQIDLKIGNWMEDAIFPSTFGLIKHSFDDNGILIIQVLEGTNKPYYLKEKGPKPSGVYKRVGSSKRKATEEEILKMILDSKRYVYENDISEEQNLTFKYLTNVFDEKKISFTAREQISLGLIDKNGQYTNLAYLLSDQSNLVVKLAEYDKNLNFKIKKEFTGSLIKIFENVEEQTNRLNDVSAIINGETFERIETKSYPGASLREIILNAFCHADYFIRSNIKIEFFPNEVKVTNPGGIFNATMEDIMNGVQTYRNPKLVHILDKLNFIENYGTGIPRTMLAYNDSTKKPEFKATENFFTVILPNLNFDNGQINGQINDQINDQIKANISDFGLEVLKLIKEFPGIKVPEIVRKLQIKDFVVNSDKVRNEIKRKLFNYIEYKGSNKTGGYYLK
jgi:predicted HTH transcriptional regulator